MKTLVELHTHGALTRPPTRIPDVVSEAGMPAERAWDDFFRGVIANDHTRVAYSRAVRSFLNSATVNGKRLHEITAADVGEYLRQMPGGLPKKKQHHSALRRFFSLLVERHLCIINPALVARTERMEITEGKTPKITESQSRQLLSAISSCTHIGLRDRAIIGILMWTGVRVGSIARLRQRDYCHSGDQHMLRFDEKRGRSREIPVRHDLLRFLNAYLNETSRRHAHDDNPLFVTAKGRCGTLSDVAMNAHDIGRMVKRHLKRSGLPTNLSPHSFRVGVATDLLEQGVPLADVQYLLGHADPRTTRLYDRRKKEVTRSIVERIRLG